MAVNPSGGRPGIPKPRGGSPPSTASPTAVGGKVGASSARAGNTSTGRPAFGQPGARLPASGGPSSPRSTLPVAQVPSHSQNAAVNVSLNDAKAAAPSSAQLPKSASPPSTAPGSASVSSSGSAVPKSGSQAGTPAGSASTPGARSLSGTPLQVNAPRGTPNAPIDSLATTDLGTLVQQFARRSHAELEECLGKAASEGTVASSAVGAARTSLLDSLQRSKEGLLRLSLLVQGSYEGKALPSGLEEARRAQVLRQHAWQARRCGDPYHMARHREELVAALATRQFDIENAVAMFSANPGVCLGWPEKMAERIGDASSSLPVHHLDDEQLQLDLWTAIAASSCDKDSRVLQVKIHPWGVATFFAQGAFRCTVSFDGRRWLVNNLEVLAGNVQGHKLPEEFVQSLQKRMQKAIIGRNVDVPKTICEVAHAFCSQVWLQILYSAALELSLQKRRDIGSVFWDKGNEPSKGDTGIPEGCIRIRLCLSWDSSGFGLLHSALSQTSSVPNVAPELLMDAPDAMSGNKSNAMAGVTLRLVASPKGGIAMDSKPPFEIPWVAPGELEEHGKESLQLLLSRARHALAAWHLERMKVALDASSDACIESCAMGEGSAGQGPVLVVTIGSVPLEIGLESSGRLLFHGGSWSDVLELSSYAERNVQGIFLRKLQTARWTALEAAVMTEATEKGWHALETGGDELPPELMQMSEKSTPQGRTGRSRIFRIGRNLSEHPLALCFELRENHVADPVVCIWQEVPAMEGTPSVVFARWLRVEGVRGIDSFNFVSSDSIGQGLQSLRTGVVRLLEATSAIIEKMTFGIQVLGNIALQTSLRLPAPAPSSGNNPTPPRYAPWLVKARLGADDGDSYFFEGELTWPEGEELPKPFQAAMPFTQPVHFTIKESDKTWMIRGALQREIALIKSDVDGDEDLADGEVQLNSGGLLRSDCAGVAGSTGNPSHCKSISLEYASTDKWMLWLADLHSVFVFCAVAAQATTSAADAAARSRISGPSLEFCCKLESCRGFRIRWRLPALEGTDTQDEVFDLVIEDQHSSAASFEAADSDGANQVPACTFQWVEPHDRFLLSAHISVLFCETLSLPEALRKVVSSVEVIRIVEDLVRKDGTWRLDALGPSTFGVGFKDVLGVEIEAATPGSINIHCQSSRRQGNQDEKLVVLPNFGRFLQSLAREASADLNMYADQFVTNPVDPAVTVLRFRPGRLCLHLRALWDYLRCYHVLWGAYLLMTTRLSDANRRLVLRAEPVSDTATGSRVVWGTVEWMLPSLSGAGCAIELQSRFPRNGPRDSSRSSLGAFEPPHKRGKISDSGNDQHEVSLAFYGAPPVAVEYDVHVVKESKDDLRGLRLRKDGTVLRVETIDKFFHAELCQRNSETSPQEGDEIVEVNSVRGNAQHLYEEMRKQRSLRMKWVKRVDAGRAETVLGTFETFLQSMFANPAKLRVSCLQPTLSLLGAPVLWMHEEAALVLRPLHASNGSAWEPIPSSFELTAIANNSTKSPASPSSDAPQERWEFQFALVPAGSSLSYSLAQQFACRATVAVGGTGKANLRSDGWDRLFVNGSDLAFWAKRALPNTASTRRALEKARPPYSLHTLLRTLLEAFGEVGENGGAEEAELIDDEDEEEDLAFSEGEGAVENVDVVM